MTTKMDRWKKISSQQNNESVVNPNKREIVESLASVPILKQNSEEDIVDSDNINNTDTNRVEGESNSNTPKDGVQVQGEQPGKQDDEQPKKRQQRGNRDKNKEQVVVEQSFADKVNNNVKSIIENKVTKEQTHKKTSFLVDLTNLAKLENYDAAHGGRQKGNFLNDLLENFFDDLERNNPEWKAILNNNLDGIIARIAKRR